MAAPSSSAFVVVLLFPVQRIPLVTGIFEVAPVAVGITYPPSGAAVVLPVSVFGLFPTSVAVVVTLYADAMVTVGVAALIGASGCWGRQ